jgi:hypothetical protein
MAWSPDNKYLAATFINQGVSTVQWYLATDGSPLTSIVFPATDSTLPGNASTYSAQVEKLLWSLDSTYLAAASSPTITNNTLMVCAYTLR